MVTTELINLDIEQMADTESAIRYLEQEGYVVSSNNLMNSNYVTPENAYHYYVITEDEWGNMKMNQGYPNSTSGVIVLGAVSESTSADGKSTITFDNAIVVYYTSEDATSDINTKAEQMGDQCTAHSTYGTAGLLVGTSTVSTGGSPVMPNPVIELSNIDLDVMSSQGVEAYLSSYGYESAYANGQSFISNAGGYEYHQITAEEVTEYFGDLLISSYNSVYLVKGSYYDVDNSKGQMAIILHYNDKDQAAESLNNIVEEYTGLATEGITMNILQQNYSGSEEYGYVAIFAVEVIMDSTSGGETKKRDIASFNFEEASKFESFSDYLLDCGYSEYPGTMDEFLRSGAGEYLFKMGVGSDFGAEDAPEAITKCEKFAPIMQIISQYEQRSAMYFKCNSKEDVAIAHEYMMSQFNMDNGPECILDIRNDKELVIGFYMKSSSGGGGITAPMRSIPLRNLNFAKSGRYTIQVSAVNGYGEGPLSAGTVVEIIQYNVSCDNGNVVIAKDDGTDPSTVLSCGSNAAYRLIVSDESKMLPETIGISGADSYYYSRQSDNNRYGFLYIYKASSDVSINFGELPNYENSFKKFTLQSIDGKVKQSFETQFSNWKDFASRTNGFAYDGQIKYPYGDTTYVVAEQDEAGTYINVTGDSAIINGATYYLIEFEADVEYSFWLVDDKGADLGTFVSDVDDWATFANREDNAFSIDENQGIAYNPGNGTYAVRYEDVYGAMAFVKVGDKISVSNVYSIPYTKQKSITFQIIDGGSSTINTTANTFADLANELDYITAVEGSEYYVTYVDPKTQTTYKLGDSNYKLWDPSDKLTYSMVLYCLTDENIANGPAVTFTLQKTDDGKVKQSIRTNTNKWSIYVTQEDNNFSESVDGYVKYTHDGIEYFIGREKKADDGSLVYNKVLTSSNIVRGTYYIVADESLLV